MFYLIALAGEGGGCRFVAPVPRREFRDQHSRDSGFPPEIISLAIRCYLRYGLSYRDVEELLAERGIEVDHVTIYR